MIKLGTAPCKLCSDPTPMQGTRMCHGCWELRGRLTREKPEVLIEILLDLGPEEQRLVFKAFDYVREKLRDNEEHY